MVAWKFLEGHFSFYVLKKYVNNLFLIIHEDKISGVLDVFNQYDHNLRFTIEKEKDMTLNFLDVSIKRELDGSIRTNWFMKPMASGRLINFHSSHSLNQKLNVASNLIKRIFSITIPANNKLCTETSIKILNENGYPTSLTKNLINKFLHKQTTTQDQNPAVLLNGTITNNAITIKSMHFIEGFSKKIVDLTRNLNDNNKKIVFGFKNVKTVGNLYSKMKDKTNTWDASNVIYQVPCSGYVRSYVGLTEQKLSERMRQHKEKLRELRTCESTMIQDEETREMRINSLIASSQLLKHSHFSGHDFNFDGCKILDHQDNNFKLKFSEMLRIKTTNNVNKRSDVEGLSSIYAGILGSIKQRDK